MLDFFLNFNLIAVYVILYVYTLYILMYALDSDEKLISRTQNKIMIILRNPFYCLLQLKSI